MVWWTRWRDDLNEMREEQRIRVEEQRIEDEAGEERRRVRLELDEKARREEEERKGGGGGSRGERGIARQIWTSGWRRPRAWSRQWSQKLALSSLAPLSYAALWYIHGGGRLQIDAVCAWQTKEAKWLRRGEGA